MAFPPTSKLKSLFQWHRIPFLVSSGLTLRVRPITGRGHGSVCSFDYAPDILLLFPLPPQFWYLRLFSGQWQGQGTGEKGAKIQAAIFCHILVTGDFCYDRHWKVGSLLWAYLQVLQKQSTLWQLCTVPFPNMDCFSGSTLTLVRQVGDNTTQQYTHSYSAGIPHFGWQPTQAGLYLLCQPHDLRELMHLSSASAGCFRVLLS